MKTRLAGIAVAAALALPIALAAAGGPTVKSEVTIDDYHAEGNVVIVTGAVESPRAACRKGRTVVVTGRDDATGDTRVFGRDRTGRNGRYEVREPIPFEEDFIHTKLRRKRLRTGAKCAGDRSEEISTAGRAAGVRRVPTEVLTYGAEYADAPPGEDDFERARAFGKVEAGKPTCARFRKLSAYMDLEAGPDVLLGTAYTDSRGYWSVTTPFENVKFGELFAKAPKAKRGKRIVCKADRSPNVQIAF
jgi:hypothetical protein